MSTPAPTARQPALTAPVRPASAEPERVLLMTRPGPAFILIRRGAMLILAIGLLLALILLAGQLPPHPLTSPLAGVTLLVVLLAWNEAVRRCERYTLTPETLRWESGVLHRLRIDLPLQRIQNTVLARSPAERLFGLGTLAAGTAATDHYELVWRSIPRPEAALDAVRAACAAAGSRANDPIVTRPPQAPASPTSLPVIGLAGGIGSGKSTVAGILGQLGCLVIDSDQRARAALDRPDVRQTLVGWWGAEILSDTGRIDRTKVARIVFADPTQREQLEGLVHPIVRQDRAAMIAEARAAPDPPRAVVIDAPLLFEAGLDRECDAILFVDAPREQRLRRVAQTRGWDEQELARREAAQWPLETKQARSTRTISNRGDQASLSAEVAAFLDALAPATPARCPHPT